eukprot:COSAG05_NODE_3283_length_2178_cov_2.184223_2_plen_224_part_00
MEPVQTKNRDFNVSQQSNKSLTGNTSYYRIHLNSLHRLASSTVTDAAFDVTGVFPVTQRQDLLDGEWEVFVEEWHAFISSAQPTNSGQYGDYPRWTLKLCLPDIMLSPQDYTTSAVGKSIRDDSVCHVPLDFTFRNQEYTATHGSDYNVPKDQLEHVPTEWNKVISHDSVGRKIDPHQLLNGNLRVMLRDREHKTIHVGAHATDGAMTDNDVWQATLLFVHKR